MKLLKTILVIFLSLFIYSGVSAQIIADPATWTFEAKKVKGNQYKIIFHLKLKEGWHIWSLTPGGDGLEIPPSFKFDNNPQIKLTGKIKEKGALITKTIDGTDGAVHEYQKNVDYIQEATVDANTTITGKYTYMVCDENMCIPEKRKKFKIEIIDAGVAKGAVGMNDTAHPDTSKNGVAATTTIDTSKKTIVTAAANTKGNNNNKPERSLVWLFLAALGGGIAAVITPCVYSMIPITVSFFTKRSKTRKEGIRNALYYSLSIIIIFTVLGVLISAIFGSNALNNLSTNWIANLVFFIIFVIFGISFLGAFEITLPSSWTSKTDSKAGVGSFAGIFFMALTLAIVSFSCTGPIVGPLLVLAGKGGIAGPAVGMFGFSVGLALPFALFAIFPGMLNKMASSGGWLNQVKVTLGFLELALALKFLSNADLAMGWRLLDREIFIALWVVLAILLGIYLLGKLKLSHDDASPKNIYGQEYVSIFKLILAGSCFTFAVYLFPGMWGAPLNAMSAFIPPAGTFSSWGGGGHNEEGNSADNIGGIKPVKYVKELKPNEPPVVKEMGLVTFFDYDEAIAASKILHKPVMLDFTGINCVNCRKMEGQVWSNPEVAKRLKNDFIVASLYCDFDRLDLPKAEQHFSKDLNSDVVTVGDKNEELQATKFGANSQPYYFYVDENGVKLADTGYSYHPEIQKFVDHLDAVKARYKQLHP